MANFIALVYATLKDEGIDTKGMSTDEAVKKFKELKGGGNERPEDVKKKLNGEKIEKIKKPVKTEVEQNSQKQNLSKEAENWADTILASTIKKTSTESLQKIIGYWKEINNVQNDAYSAKVLQVYEDELKQRK